VWRNPPGRRRVTARRSRLRRRGTLLQSAGRQLRGLWGGVGWVVWSPRRLAGVSKFRSSGGRGGGQVREWKWKAFIIFPLPYYHIFCSLCLDLFFHMKLLIP
jgi:hypothetical protein